MQIHIAKKNHKLGYIPNVSLPPIRTCVRNPPCAKDCYARRAYDGYGRATTRPAWDENLRFYRKNPYGYFTSIVEYLWEHKAKYFRWHVGGDIPSQDYYRGMQAVATLCPDVKFLAYSRRQWAWGREPENLIVLRSYWLGEPLGKEAGFVVVPKDEPIPLELACIGRCSDCHVCWNLAPGEKRVIHLH